MFISILLLSMTLSIDALGIGIAYGIRKIRLTLLSSLVISLVALIFSFISIMAGNLLLMFLPPSAAKLTGAAILIFMGLWIIMQSLSNKPEKPKESPQRSEFTSVIVQILQTPEYSDFDHSNKIEPKEALYLGIALSVDMIGGGIGISVLGVNSLLIPLCIVFFQLLFLFLGLFLGKTLIKKEIKDNTCMLLSGTIIIFIAACHLIF